MARRKPFSSPVLPREHENVGELEAGENPPDRRRSTPHPPYPYHSSHSPHSSPQQLNINFDRSSKRQPSRTAFQSSGDTIAVASSQLRAAFQTGHSPTMDRPKSATPAHNSLPERARSLTPSPPVPVTSQRAKMMIKCARNLRSIGIENAVPELPSICVVGDQSVGKSSLIEAISGISVPRSAGTCTRCPLEINLINTSQAPGEWRCELYLVKNYYFDGTKTAASKDRPYGPWIPQGQENYLFATTNSKDDLRDLIARAQLAILNPSMNPAQYLHQAPSDRANHRQVKFSPNVIRLDIFSTEVSELSLFDLPGVITVPETDDERYLVGIVDKLVRSYTSSSQSIILLALPMTNDATNSKAVNIIQRSGAKHRTVGVLTKPDLFQLSESFEQWLDILWGYKFDLGHGYFVVCNAADVSVGHAEARAHERRFFATPPWASAPLAELSDRFGTDNLSKQLQCLLEKRIQDGLPAIHESIDARIAVITEDLKKLPAPRDMPAVLTISQSLNTCNRGLEALFSSSSRSGETFRREWNGLAKRFRAVLERSRPRMKRRSKAEEKKTEKLAQLRQTPAVQENADSQVINVESEPEDCPPTPSVGEKRKRNNPWDEFSGVEYYLDDIRAIINDYASNIPNLLNPRAIEVMNQQSVQHWSLPLNYFLDQVQRLISAHIKAVVTKAFDPQQQKARLHEQVMLQVDGFINTSMAAQVSKVEDMVSIEVMCPYTSDEHAMKRERNAIWEILSRARLETRLSDAGQTMTPKKGQPRVAAESLGPDEWVREVEMFSTVRAYYQIAFSRFADNILQVTQCNLFSALRTGLSDQLDSYFSVTTKAGQELCEELLADDPDVINARRELREEIMRLERARAEIETVFAADSATNDAYGGLNDNSQGAGNGDKSASTMENDMDMYKDD